MGSNKSKTYYLHLINGMPAYFDGNQIVAANFYGEAPMLATSQQQIRREQEASNRYRSSRGWGAIGYYSHRKFRVPND